MQFFRNAMKCLIAEALLLVPAQAWADVTPRALISDGMVLQQGREVNIWGRAEPGEKVTVRFRDQEQSTVSSSDGKWRIRVDSKQAGGPFPLTIAGNNTIALKNVFVGEVWVCSGQSNMWWPVATRPGAKELAGTENPAIRLFTVPQRSVDAPTSELEGQWRECGPDTLVNFSAVAYYFGSRIQATQNVPVGLIHASVGGTGVGAWTSARTLEEDPELQGMRDTNAKAAEASARNLERLRPEIERYRAAVAKAEKDGTPPPAPPRGLNPPSPTTSRLYNGMIAPLQPFNIRGVIWYQGEANVSRAGDYQSLFSAMIRGWRREWGQGDFPFLFVQLAPFKNIVDQPPLRSEWAELREAQLRTSLTVPQTGMAVITDWGHENDIHVKQKRPVGERLALIARALVYGEKVTYSGPAYSGMKVRDNQAVLSFTHVGSGLAAKSLVLEDLVQDARSGAKGGALHVATNEASAAKIPLQGFSIAGEDRKFVNAQAEIRGDTVVVSSPQVDKPVAVRFGWADYPTGNLFNMEGLPASPFRTDDWDFTR